MKFSFSLIVKLGLVIAFLFSMTVTKPAAAQSGSLKYTAQAGDTLASIAQAFHTTTGRILKINFFANPDELVPGRRVIIPGFDDVQGEIIRVNLPFGKSLPAFFASTGQPLELLERLNFITSLDQTYAGAPLYIMFTDQPALKEIQVSSSLTGLELAVKNSVSKWLPSEINQLHGPWVLLPNTSLYLPDKEAVPGISETIIPDLTVSPFPLLQGKTVELIATAPVEGASLSGTLTLSVNDSLGQSTNYTPVNYPLHFFPDDEGRLTALQGVHRFTKPGFAPMVLTTTFADGSNFNIQQNVLVKNQDYGLDAPLVVDESYIDPELTIPEWELVKSLIQTAPPEKQWVFSFRSPSPSEKFEGQTSTFGRVRSYNESDYIYFHSGIDYTGNSSTPIFAVAAGDVVFAGNLDVRGGITILSHGRGVYTAYFHQSRIDVKVGDHVEAGQTIGMVGNTGRVTGAHLHFEVLVGGVQVDPVEWLQGLY